MSAAVGAFLAPVLGGIAGNVLSQGDRDKASRLSQQAYDVVSGVRVPSPEELRIVLEELKTVGMYSPQLEEAITLQSSKMNEVATDPRLKEAQMSALQKLQQISDEGGLTMQDKAQLSQIQNEVNSNLKGNVDAVTQNMATRGMSGGMGELVSKQIAVQQSANRNAQQGMDVAAMAQQRALNALMQGGTLANQMQTTDFNQQSKVAEANDAISKFNSMNQQDVRSRNTQNLNSAQKSNLSEAQRISDANVTNRNAQQTYNKQLEQDYFNNQMKKAATLSGQSNNLADQATSAANRTAGMYAGIGSAIGQGASAYNQQQTEDERLAKYGRTK